MPREGGALAVLARWPEPGQVLPGLGRQIGPEAAAQIYESFLEDLVATLGSCPVEASLFVNAHEDLFRARFPSLAVRRQQGRGERERLRTCFRELLHRHSRAVVIGSSLPDLHPRMLFSAFEMLERRDAVVGPTERGGFYLLGMRRPRDVFASIKWGTGGVLAALLRNLERAGLDYGFFPTRQKVETGEDLVGLRRRLRRGMAPRTYEALRSLDVGRGARGVG
jgi:rSAM/selenodomain-associated transferase 1